MNLSAPRQVTLIVSVLIAIVALLVRYAGVPIPFISDHPFGTMLIAYVVLLIGNLFDGI